MKKQAHHGAGRDRPRRLTDAHCYALILSVMLGSWLAAVLLTPSFLARVEAAKPEVDLRYALYEPVR